MSGGIVLHKLPVKGKDLTQLTYEQVSEDLSHKKQPTPFHTYVEGTSDVKPKAPKKKVTPVTPGLPNVQDESEVTFPIEKQKSALKIKSKGKRH
jgi:hypothetical protein